MSIFNIFEEKFVHFHRLRTPVPRTSNVATPWQAISPVGLVPSQNRTLHLLRYFGWTQFHIPNWGSGSQPPNTLLPIYALYHNSQSSMGTWVRGWHLQKASGQLDPPGSFENPTHPVGRWRELLFNKSLSAILHYSFWTWHRPDDLAYIHWGPTLPIYNNTILLLNIPFL